MNFRVLVLAVFLVGGSFARGEGQNTDVCTKFFQCGVFTANSKGSDGKEYTTTITIESKGPNLARFLYGISAPGEEGSRVDLLSTFQDNGAFVMTLPDGFVYASGICESLTCSYGMHPWPNENGETVANAGLIRFKEDALEFLMTSGTPVKDSKNLTIYQKQK